MPRTLLLRRVLAASAVATTVLLASCGDDGESAGTQADAADGSAQTREFEADNGSVEIPVEPRRVVATGYAVPVLIEAGAPLVGISTWERGTALMGPDDLATYEALDKVAGETAADTSYEAVAAADPDLIVVGVPLPVLEDVDMPKLEAIAPVVVLGPTEPDQWRELSARQADAAGRADALAASQADYERLAADLREKYADALDGLAFAHVGAYGSSGEGTFMREYARSWGTNIAGDIGVEYPGEPLDPGEGSAAVSEYPSVEQLRPSLGAADVVTYTVQPDGSPVDSVRAVLDSDLWKDLPAVRDGLAFPVRYTEATTYASAMTTLEALDETFAPLLER